MDRFGVAYGCPAKLKIHPGRFSLIFVRRLENMFPDGFRSSRAYLEVAFLIWNGGEQIPCSDNFKKYERLGIFQNGHLKIHVFIKNSRHMISTNIPVAFPPFRILTCICGLSLESICDIFVTDLQGSSRTGCGSGRARVQV